MTKKHQKHGSTFSKLSLTFFFLTIFILYLIHPQDFWHTLTMKTRAPAVRSTDLDFKVSQYPINQSLTLAPQIFASAAAVLDLNSMVPIYQKNIHQKQKPASLTKMMTALVALEYYKLDDILEVKNLFLEKGDAKMDLKLGDKVSVKTLLYGLLLPSGNDAAWVLANSLPGGKDEFVASMNKKVKDLHLNSTHFTNSNGKDEPDHYSTAYDLVIIAKELLNKPSLAPIVKTNWIAIDRFYLQNVNQLLSWYPGIYGIKTGFTDEAGQCLIAAAKRGENNYLSIVLNSPNRFTESQLILDWAFASFVPEDIAKQLPDNRP